jgi:thymidylate synthase (FAD)
MIVRLLQCTPDAEHLVTTAARQCYNSGYVGYDYNNTINDEQLLSKVISMGHLSILEHASYTFAIGNVSRSLTHQLVRFRIASFSQQSQRYCGMLSINFIYPPSIAQSDEAEFVYNEALTKLKEAFKVLIDLGIPQEDARFILPNATATHIVMTMNARELLHAFSLRCCKHAQWEIREMFNEILKQVKEISPLIFKNAGANCVRGTCTEGERSCESVASDG